MVITGLLMGVSARSVPRVTGELPPPFRVNGSATRRDVGARVPAVQPRQKPSIIGAE